MIIPINLITFLNMPITHFSIISLINTFIIKIRYSNTLFNTSLSSFLIRKLDIYMTDLFTNSLQDS